jgi:hypothetical protein
MHSHRPFALDYDLGSLAMLLLGIGAVAVLALGGF